jgi:hypothetical protein
MAQGTSTGKPPSRCSGCACTREYSTCCGVHTPQMSTDTPSASSSDEVILNALARAVGIAGGGGGDNGDDGSKGIVRDRISLPVAMGGWGMRQWADLAPVAFLWQERQPPSPPSSTAASPNTQVTRKTAQAKAGAAGGAAAAKTRAAQAAAAGVMCPSEETCAAASNTGTSPEHAPAQRTPEPPPQACAVPAFPHVGRRLLGEGAFDTRGHGDALLLQGQSTLGTELSTAWASLQEGS